MTEILCHKNSYEKTFSARVTGVDEAAHGVILDRTAFYPGGGGKLWKGKNFFGGGGY